MMISSEPTAIWTARVPRISLQELVDQDRHDRDVEQIPPAQCRPPEQTGQVVGHETRSLSAIRRRPCRRARRSAGSGIRAALIRSATRTTSHHRAHGVDADDVGAAEDAGGDGGGGAPVPLGRPGGRPAPRRRNDLRDGPTRSADRAPRARRARPGQLGVLGPLGEADARDRGRSPPGGRRRRSPAHGRPRARRATSAHRRRRRPPRGTSPATARGCASGRAPRLSPRPRAASPGSYRRPLTSLTIAAPRAIAARATAAL